MKCDNIISSLFVKSTSGKQVENQSLSGNMGRGFYNYHSPLERGQHVLERVFRYYYYGSINALASVPGFSPLSSK